MNKENLKIIHIISSGRRGGSQKHTLLLAREQQKAGHKLVIACPPHGPYINDVQSAGIETYPLAIGRKTWRWNWRELTRFSSFVKKSNFAVAHAHELRAEFAAWLSSFLHRPRLLVTTIHNMLNYGDIPGYKRSLYRLLFKIMARRFQLIICVSQAVKDNTIQYFGIKAHKVKAIHNGVDLAESDEAQPAHWVKGKFSLPPQARLIGMVGRMIPKQKGFEILIPAARKVVEKNPNAYFLVCGDGPLRQQLEGQARQAGMAKNLLFLGWQEETAPIYKLMEICLVPSLWDPFPRTMLEAMAAGRPVIASRVHGVPEAITDRYNGILVEPGNSEQLAAAILQLLDNDELRQILGQNARKTVAEKFTIQQQAQNTIRTYLEFLHKAQ